MNTEINYPIKYAVLELKEKGGYDVGYEDITCGFIVSKCYVIESSIRYRPNGRNEVTHKVVFPFDDISALKRCFPKHYIGQEVIPSYDYYDQPYPVRQVANLYDSYESAKIEAEERNGKYAQDRVLKKSLVPGSDWEKIENSVKQEMDQELQMCYLFEQLALEKIQDMKISKPLSTDKSKSLLRILKPIKKKNPLVD